MDSEEEITVAYFNDAQRQELERERTIETYVDFEDGKRIKITNQSRHFIIFTLQDRIRDSDEWKDTATFAISFEILEGIKELVSEFMMIRKMHPLFHLLPIQKRFMVRPNHALIVNYINKETIEIQEDKRNEDDSWTRLPDSFKINISSLYTAISIKEKLDGTNMHVLQRFKDQDRCKHCVRMERDEDFRNIPIHERIKNDKKCRECFSFLKFVLNKDDE